jgi:hypothetical protein
MTKLRSLVESVSLDQTGSGEDKGSLDWIELVPGIPYFQTERGEAWTPIGQNDAITWPELAGIYGRRDLAGVERHLRYLKASGVTCLRLMLEYVQTNRRLFELQVGRFNPPMVQVWDDLFRICERVGLRILLTPYDTFFMWNRWKHHPYNKKNGGPCPKRTKLLTCAETRKAIKARLAFASERWGSSGALFAWDIWNEMHPVQGENRFNCFAEYIDDVSPFLREFELKLHGRAHLQTVSIFGPELGWKEWLNEPIFRHSALDFANSHFYEEGTIDHPRNTVAPAISTGRLVREALAQISDARPFFDSEHGPIHTYKDFGRTLPASFDDEYFRHMQWAHFAAGSAGGGMRWPNRYPHVLTPGMRLAQLALSRFLPLIEWKTFRRRNLNDEIAVLDSNLACFGCGDDRQAVVWLLRKKPLRRDGRLDRNYVAPLAVKVPGLATGAYRAVLWDTTEGVERGQLMGTVDEAGALTVAIPAMGPDLAVAIGPAL